jgi:hypothetical protein
MATCAKRILNESPPELITAATPRRKPNRKPLESSSWQNALGFENVIFAIPFEDVALQLILPF